MSEEEDNRQSKSTNLSIHDQIIEKAQAFCAGGSNLAKKTGFKIAYNQNLSPSRLRQAKEKKHKKFVGEVNMQVHLDFV